MPVSAGRALAAHGLKIKTLRDRPAPGQTVGLVREGEALRAPRLHLLSEGSRSGGAFWLPRG